MTEENEAPEETTTETGETTAKSQTFKIGLIAVLCVGALITAHLVGDRATPYSDQARVQANVVSIAPEVGGTVETIHVANNQRVKAGDPLFSLGKEQFQLAISKAEADIVATKRDLNVQAAGVTVAQAGVEVARAELNKASLEASRFERIYREDSGAISTRRLELSRAAFVEGRSRLNAALAQLEQAKQSRGDIGSENDRLIVAEAALAKARLDLARTTVLAPGAGLITDLKVDKGQFAGPGNAIMAFIAIRDGWISVDMTENNLGQVKVGAPAEIVLDALPGEVISGKVRSIGFGVSASGPTPLGALPTVQNSRDFLRSAQRFPVIVEFDPRSISNMSALRQGGQAEVIIYAGDNPIMNFLGSLYIRMMSLFSYAY